MKKLLGVTVVAFSMFAVNSYTADSAVIAPGAKPEKLAEEFKFTEGPTSDAAGNVFFTDQPNDRIMKWSVDGKLSTFLQPCGRANGMYFDSKGNIIACADEKNELWSIDPSGKHTVLVKDYEGKLLNGPNDVWVRPDDALYFTDPHYKRDYWKRGPKEQGEHVYFLTADHQKLTRVVDDLKQPNGIIGTPDGKMLYVADIGSSKTYSYEIQKDGPLTNKRLFCQLGSDGMTIDNLGLERIGYRFADTALSASYYEDHHFHRILRSAQGIYLETHWAVTLPASVYSFDLEALRRDAVRVPFGSTELLAPSSLDQILHGTLQSIASGFADLRRFLDLHLLDRTLDDATRQRLAERALAGNLGTALWLQYRVREELTGMAIPAAVVATCAPTPRLRLLIENLDVAGACLAQIARERVWYERLVHLLCVPDRCRNREIRRFLLPDLGGLIEAGLGPQDLRNPLRRARLIAGRVFAGARMAEMCLRARLAPMQWR